LKRECDQVLNLVYSEEKDLVFDFGCILEPFSYWMVAQLASEDNTLFKLPCCTVNDYIQNRKLLFPESDSQLPNIIVKKLASLARKFLPVGDIYLICTLDFI